MRPDDTMQRMRQQLIDLQAALIDLRHELCKMSLSLQDQAVAGNREAAGIANAETAALFKRLRG